MSRKQTVRRLFYRRSFLNRRGHHGGAFVIAEIELVRHQHGYDVEASFDVADCNRLVSLDFGVWPGSTDGERANALHKARLLRDTLVAFTERLELAVEEATRRQSEHDADQVRRERSRDQRGEVRP